MRDERTEVLVVGAGPVGLFTALLLAEAGLQVNIIDREQRTAARSYACALHPQTQRLFAQLNLAPPLLELGKRISTVAFYDHEARRAEVNLSVPMATTPPYVSGLASSRNASLARSFSQLTNSNLSRAPIMSCE
jgi:2-polyprenyl-6-methoxyphenol hydroxylase-like FAD-dependent oxidoreductase